MVVFFPYRTFESNNLTSLPKDIFEGLTRLKHITLGGNPLICDCHLTWLSKWLKKAPKTASQARCNSPYHLRDKTIDEVLETEFKCAGMWEGARAPILFLSFWYYLRAHGCCLFVKCQTVTPSFLVKQAFQSSCLFLSSTSIQWKSLWITCLIHINRSLPFNYYSSQYFFPPSLELYEEWVTLWRPKTAGCIQMSVSLGFSMTNFSRLQNLWKS